VKFAATIDGATGMKRWMYCVAIMLALGSLVSGCATDEPQKPCTGDACVADAEITSNIESSIRERSELTDWTIEVQTIHGVVYLHGLVDTVVQRDLVESIARETRGVEGVENSIELRNAR
jgi:hyperosmotically inducible periplasmic protein